MGQQIKELETSAAFQRGADFMSETFIFVVGGGVIVFEYSRSKASEAAKAREKATQWLDFTQVRREQSGALDSLGRGRVTEGRGRVRSVKGWLVSLVSRRFPHHRDA